MAEYQYAKSGDPIGNQLQQKEAELRAASDALRDRLMAFFARWEREHGFKQGAGVLLVPAGWRPR